MRANPRSLVLIVTLSLLSSIASGAAFGGAVAHGQKPIGTSGNQPLTITQSGTYVLAEDIVVDTPPAIIIAAPAVTIDLAGHTVGTPGFDNGAVISLEAGSHQLSLANGTVSGGGACVGSDLTGIVLTANGIHCSGGATGIVLNASSVGIENSQLTTDREALRLTGSYALRLLRNTFATTDAAADALDLTGIRRGLIALNDIGSATHDGTLLSVEALDSLRIEYNTLTADQANIGMSLGAGTYSLTGNVITGTRSSAILVQSSGNRLLRNQVSHGAAIGDAITILGDDNAVLSNRIEDYSCGVRVLGSGNGVSGNRIADSRDTGVTIGGDSNTIAGNTIGSDFASTTEGLFLQSTSAGNRYKTNAFSGNPGGDVVDDGTGNVDYGGNTHDRGGPGADE